MSEGKQQTRGRQARRLDEEAVRAFLASKPGWAILTTQGRDGFPHSVPLGYFMVDGDIVLGTMAGTQKMRNIERDPHVSVVVESSDGSNLVGVMIQGLAEAVLDDAPRLALQHIAARQRGTPDDQLPKAPRPGGAFVRVRPHRFISWQYGG